MDTNNNNLESYYQVVQKNGYLRTPGHAQLWSTAVLRTLGFHLDRGVKKQLAQALPKELGFDVTRIFWLLHFRQRHLSRQEFLEQVARRSGNTDIQFAQRPTTAVFRAVKEMIDTSLSQRIAEMLSPEVRELWERA